MSAHAATVRDRFSNEAHNWHRLYDRAGESLYAHNITVRRDRVVAWVHDLSGNLLDIGCATGHLATRLDRSDRHVTAIDFSRDMLKQTRRTAQAVNAHVDLLSADATSVPVATESVDGVMCLGLIEYVECPIDVVAECHRVLKPGGTFVLSLPNALSPFIRIDDAIKRAKNTVTQTLFPTFLRRGLKRLISKQDRPYFSHRRHRLNPDVIAGQLSEIGFDIVDRRFHTYGLGVMERAKWNIELSKWIEFRLARTLTPGGTTGNPALCHQLEKTGWTCLLKATKRS